MARGGRELSQLLWAVALGIAASRSPWLLLTCRLPFRLLWSAGAWICADVFGLTGRSGYGSRRSRAVPAALGRGSGNRCYEVAFVAAEVPPAVPVAG